MTLGLIQAGYNIFLPDALFNVERILFRKILSKGHDGLMLNSSLGCGLRLFKCPKRKPYAQNAWKTVYPCVYQER